MVSSLALKKMATSSNLFAKLLLRPVASASVSRSPASRLFAARDYSEGSPIRPDPPFSGGSKSQSGEIGGWGEQRCWDFKDTDKGIHLRLEMLEVGKDDLEVLIEDIDGEKTLVIRGEGRAYDGGVRHYRIPMSMLETLFKIHQAQVVLEDGLLKVFVPKNI